MGSGLSMTSVNKIKELAEQREYSLALEIVDSQDLTKSLNPQFLRLCGEIYIKTNRLLDARKVLIMAHKLAPEGKRVIYSLTYLYLKMGYKELAKKYYDLYLFDADENNSETKQIKYIYKKAGRYELEELESLLTPLYVHNMDYEWSFETFLLFYINGKKHEAEILASDFCATFKNSEYSRAIENILAQKEDATMYFDVFSSKSVEDNDPEQEDIRQEESVLLEADDLRIHPKEAEITIMVDDDEEVDVGTKRKLKKFRKNQEKQKNIEDSELDSEYEDVSDDVDDVSQDETENADEDTDIVEKQKVKGLFKKVFSKIKRQQDEADDELEAEDSENNDSEKEADSMQENKIEEVADSFNKTETDDTRQDTENSEIAEESSVVGEDTNEETDFDVTEEKDVFETIVSEEETVDSDESENFDNELEDIADEDTDEELEFESDGDADMREIHTKKHKSIVSIDLDDNDFNAESDTIEGLNDEEFTNPFDSISAFKKEKEEPVFVPKRKTEFMFEDIDFSSNEDEEEFDIDDFSSNEDDEFGEMKSNLDKLFDESDSEEDVITSQEIPVEAEEEAEINLEFLDDVDKEIEPELEEVESVESELEETEPESEEVENEDSELEETEYEELESEEDEVSEEYVEEAEPEETEPELEEVENEDSELEETEYEELESEEDEVSEEYVEEAETEETEPESEEAESEEIESEEEEVSEEYVEEAEPEETEPELEEVENEDSELEETEYEELESEEDEVSEEYVEEAEPEETEPESEEVEYEEPESEEEKIEVKSTKKTLDYPVFRSSLFPNHNREISQVKNNFNEIMTEAQDKIQENLLKEEQMQREAEALLASLGIDLNSITVTSDSIESINNTLYNEPSRDELKASLRIDSVKKSILRRLKEYR